MTRAILRVNTRDRSARIAAKGHTDDGYLQRELSRLRGDNDLNTSYLGGHLLRITPATDSETQAQVEITEAGGWLLSPTDGDHMDVFVVGELKVFLANYGNNGAVDHLHPNLPARQNYVPAALPLGKYEQNKLKEAEKARKTAEKALKSHA